MQKRTSYTVIPDLVKSTKLGWSIDMTKLSWSFWPIYLGQKISMNKNDQEKFVNYIDQYILVKNLVKYHIWPSFLGQNDELFLVKFISMISYLCT